MFRLAESLNWLNFFKQRRVFHEVITRSHKNLKFICFVNNGLPAHCRPWLMRMNFCIRIFIFGTWQMLSCEFLGIIVLTFDKTKKTRSIGFSFGTFFNFFRVKIAKTDNKKFSFINWFIGFVVLFLKSINIFCMKINHLLVFWITCMMIVSRKFILLISVSIQHLKVWT